jgi:multiple sugar transport system substrate-binding protein
MREYFRLSPQYVRFGPQPGLRNPDASQVKLPAVKPDESEIVRGLFTGQLTDVAQVLRDLDAAKQQALETAIADAQAAGAKVSIDDFVFADWDPTKDYVAKSA